MDLHGDEQPTAVVAEPPLPPPPSGKLNKTAFKLFKRRRPGGAMPSIFGVRSSSGGKGKSGEGSTSGQSAGGGGGGGMVRSKTHDGLAEVGLEGGGTKGEQPGDGGEHGASAPGAPAKDASSPGSSSASASASAASAVGKSHSFFSLLRKNGRPSEGGERPPKGRGGLRGLFSSMRWHRREKPGMKEEEEEAAAAAGGPGERSSQQQGHPGRLMPGSLTASLECVKEETPPPRPPPTEDPQVARPPSVGEQLLDPQDAEESPTVEEKPGVGFFQEMLLATPYLLQGEELARVQPQVMESRLEPHRDGEEQKTQEDAAITGCGDIIADQEEDVSVGSGKVGGRDAVGSGKGSPGLNKVGASKKPPSVVTYQGGGEEMASPEQVGDTSTPGFWEVLSQTEGKPQEETPGRKESPKASKDGSFAQSVQDASITVQQAGVSQIPTHHNHKEDQKSREKEPQEAVPSSDEGYWDSTTPGPEEDNASSIQKEAIPRDSYSGDALYDLYADPDENSATVTSADVTSVTCSKPLSPVTTTCPVKTHTTSLKDSKIPISIKHFTSPHSSHGPDTSNSHHLVHHQPTKSEIPRTKIPVSKVLVHRASYRSLSGTTGKIATYHEGAKK